MKHLLKPIDIVFSCPHIIMKCCISEYFLAGFVTEQQNRD